MSTTPQPSIVDDARVIDLTAARARGAGQRTVERLCDGRRKGNHGNRAMKLMREAAIRNLRDILTLRGQVTAADKAREATAAGVTERTLNRWWAQELDRQLELVERLGNGDGAGHPPGPGAPEAGANAPVDLPRYLYRYAEPGRLQLTGEEIAFFGRHTTTKAAIDAVHADPTHRLRNYARSTIYNAYANVTEPVRVGARKNSKSQRQIEATYPLTGRDAINESWSIDEYDLKVTAAYNGVRFEPKLLLVRERLSGLPLAYTVLDRAATGVDTGKVLAAAAIGYTIEHPSAAHGETGRLLRVCGVARHLVSDQGGSFLGEPGVAAARRLGISMTPRPSHQPQANGDHEQMHQSLLAHFADGPGSRRGWADRAGNRYDHGVLPFEVVVEEVGAWFDTYIESSYTFGDRAGRSRLQVYADHLEAGNAFNGHELTPADEAALATVVATQKYDPTRGVKYLKEYWLGPELASAARKGDDIELRQLLDPAVLYAFTTTGTFIGIVRPRAEADLDDVYAVQGDRARRASFVKDRIAKPRALLARQQAEAYWDEVADALADAADLATLHTAAEDARRAVAAGTTTPDLQLTGSTTVTSEPAAPGEPEVLDLVKPTNRLRRARGSSGSRAGEAPYAANVDEQANTIASLFQRGPADVEAGADDGDDGDDDAS